MNKLLVKNIIRFILLILVQVFVLNNIELNRFLNPYIYVLFVLFLPLSTPGWLLILSSFLLGISIDIFMKTPGMNAAATVFMAFSRPGVIGLLSRGMDIESNMKAGIPDFGKRWFFSYTLILVFFHHFVLFFIEVFSFHNFINTFYYVIINTLLTSAIIIVVHYLSINRD